MEAGLLISPEGGGAPYDRFRDRLMFPILDARGRIVSFGGRAMTYYGRWTYKYEEAARQGAAGVIIVHETAPASYGWATVTNSWSGPQFDIVRQNAAAERVPMEAWIQRDVAVDLFQRAGQDFEALKVAARSRDFRPVELSGVRLAADVPVAHEVLTSRNVLARIPGTTRADEVVMFGAHWDAYGKGKPDAQGRIYRAGANDDALGIAGMFEIARGLMAGPKPARSVVFAAWTAEERGLLGSEYYAANPVYPMAKTVAIRQFSMREPVSLYFLGFAVLDAGETLV